MHSKWVFYKYLILNIPEISGQLTIIAYIQILSLSSTLYIYM